MTATPFSLRRLGATLLVALVGTGCLGACAPLVVGGAVVGGAMVATDRRTTGTQVDDQVIEMKINSRIDDSLGDLARISVTSFNRRVLLTGEVPNETDRSRAEAIAARVENVQSVVNELVITEPRSWPRRSGDGFITAKVKASLVDANDVFGNSVKVVTHQGVVYLMGRVGEREAERATEVARGVSGVVKVVRVFEILSEAELAKLRTTTPSP